LRNGSGIVRMAQLGDGILSIFPRRQPSNGSMQD
jgi:hypothetical protein